MLNDSENVGELIQQISQKKPDLVELRLDKLQTPRILETVSQKKTFPAVAAIRSSQGSAEKLLLEAARLGFEYVDVDISSPFATEVIKQTKAHGTEIIVSFHDFDKTPPPDKLNEVLNSGVEMKGDICKIVTTARQPRDNLTVLDFVQERAEQNRLVSFAMGPQGVPSRILSPFFGAEFTFASLTEEKQTADGQLSIDSLRSVWQVLGVQ
jgi:3-dehydroquinate dehydratase type I